MTEISEKVQKKRAQRSDEYNSQALRMLVMTEDDLKSLTKNAPGQGGGSPGQSTNVTEDPFNELSNTGRVILPPFNLLSLATLPEQNTELTPVIETMQQNIEGFGHVLQPRLDLKKIEDEAERDAIQKEMNKEKVRLINFFNYANIKISFTELRKRTRKDLEATGNAYWEVIRNSAGQIQGFEHIPSYQMRLGKLEEQHVEVQVPMLELQEDGSWEVTTVPNWQRFRQFVQSRLTPLRGLIEISQGGFKNRWFKEFGDPRVFDNETGLEVKDAAKIEKLPQYKRANEIIHFKMYSCRSPYGLPRYIGALLSIFGARAAEEINYTTFKNNNIPSMAVLVAGGRLTDGTLKRINSFVESKIQGSDNYSRFLLIEAEGDEDTEDSNQIKLDIKPLTKEQARDALFQNYMMSNQANVRRSFRIPPIFVGQSDDYTRSTADSSRRLADEQVFAPERMSFDDFINRTLFPHMNVKYHRFKSNSPNTTDNQQLVKILAQAEKTGGMTPEIARIVLEDILGRELPSFPTQAEAGDFFDLFNPKMPFSLLMAEAVKNQAQPAEPSQQVTAVKVLEKHLSDVHGDDFDPEETLGELMLPLVSQLRKKLEDQFESEVASGYDLGE